MSEFNPRTQGISSEGTLASYRNHRDMNVIDVKERVNETTGELIPAHKAIVFFTAKRNADGSKMRDNKGQLVAEPKTSEFVSFGPSVSDLASLDMKKIASELTARRNELEVGALAESGNKVLYKPSNNGFVGEEVAEW